MYPGPRADDQRVPVTKPGAQLRHVDARRERPGLLAEVDQRVLRKGRERVGNAALLLVERCLERRLVELGARGEQGSVPPDLASVDPEVVAVRHLLEELCAGRVDQPHAGADELERAGVRKASGRRGCDVDDDADAARSELLGRDAVDVGVIDDRDVVRAEVLDELLRQAPEPCAACHLTVHVSRRPRSPLRRMLRRRASARARRGALRRRARRSACVSGRPGPSRPAGAGRPRSRSAAGA